MIIRNINNDRRSVHLDNNNCSVAPLGVGNGDTAILGTSELVEKLIFVLIVALVDVVIIAVVDVILLVGPDNCNGVPI